MNNELNNIDDLLDDSIGKSLRQLGFTFPRTVDDFNRIEEYVKNNKPALPKRLQDPSTFLDQKVFKSNALLRNGQEIYFQNLAQAARDGKVITDDVKKKMAEDKLNSGKKKKDD